MKVIELFEKWNDSAASDANGRWAKYRDGKIGVDAMATWLYNSRVHKDNKADKLKSAMGAISQQQNTSKLISAAKADALRDALKKKYGVAEAVVNEISDFKCREIAWELHHEDDAMRKPKKSYAPYSGTKQKYGVKINGKMWMKGGKPVEFMSLAAAQKATQSERLATKTTEIVPLTEGVDARHQSQVPAAASKAAEALRKKGLSAQIKTRVVGAAGKSNRNVMHVSGAEVTDDEVLSVLKKHGVQYATVRSQMKDGKRELMIRMVEDINEAFKLKDKVKIVKGPKDVVGKEGFIGEIRTYVTGKKYFTIDYKTDSGRETSVMLTADQIRNVKE